MTQHRNDPITQQDSVDLAPLRASHEADQIEAELKALFIEMFTEFVRAAERVTNTAGTPHLGPFAQVERAVKNEGLALYRRPDESAMRYLFRSWRARNPKRGLHMLRTYLQLLWPNGWTVEQLHQLKTATYPDNLSTIVHADRFTTSRVRVAIESANTTGDDVLATVPALRSVVPARIVLEFAMLTRMEQRLAMASGMYAGANFQSFTGQTNGYYVGGPAAQNINFVESGGVPAPLAFVGGGGRTARRITGAVGISRTNHCQFPRSIGDWYAVDATVTSNVEANPFDGVVAVDEVAFAAALNARVYLDTTITIENGDRLTIMLDVWSAAPANFNIQFLGMPSTAQWSHEDILHLSAGWRRYKMTTQAVNGLTTDTQCRVYLVTRDGVARTVRIDRVHIKKGTTESEPFIEGTTTNWPRRNLVNFGSTPSSGGWTTDALALLTLSDVYGPTGKRMSKLTEHLGGRYTYSYVELAGFAGVVAGVTLGYRFFFRDGGRTDKIVTFDVLQFPGAVSVASVQVNVQTGECNMLAGTLKGRFNYGDGLFGVEVEGTTTQASTTLVDAVLSGTEDGTGHFFGTLQCGEAPLGTIIDNENIGPSAVVNSAPFGDLVPVDEDEPRFVFDINGVNLGLGVSGLTPNLLNKSQDELNNGSVWTHYQVAPTNTAADPMGGTGSRKFVSVISGVDPHQCYQLGQVIAAPGVFSGSVHLMPDEVVWAVANLYDSTGDHRVWFHLPTLTIGQTAVGFTPYIERVHNHIRIGLTGTLQAGVNAGFSFELTTGDGAVFSTIPVGSGLYAWGANFAPGPMRPYVPGNAPSSAAAEYIAGADLAALGMGGDAWTVIVKAREPQSLTPPAYSTIFRVDGAGGSYIHIYQASDGSFVFEAWNGSAQTYLVRPAGTPGKLRKYALGFNRASGVMRVAVTGGGVADTQSADLVGFPALSSARVGSGSGNRHIEEVLRGCEVRSYLLTKPEFLNAVAAP
ncbi:MAG: hypothetical protein LCH79_16185 [Proteobacteria bacterium]|nr:hypothetical protein [Pseudomonadota bacterium]